jgi:hypothetical protein
MDIPKVKQERALRIALNLVSEVTLREVWDMACTLTDHGQEIAAAIDPRAKDDDEKSLKLYDSLLAKLDQEGKKRLLEYDNGWCDRDFWRCASQFYLGFALALKLMGLRHPRMKVMDGGRAVTSLKGRSL